MCASKRSHLKAWRCIGVGYVVHLLIYHIGFGKSLWSSLFQPLFGRATKSKMRACVCVCVCVRGREKISQCGSKNLAQVLLLWLIFRWQGLSGASLPSCQHLTSLPPLLSIPSAFSLLLVLSFSSPFFCHPVKDQEQLLSPGSSCLLALFSSIQQTVKNQFVPLFFFSIKGKILSLCSSCSKSV